MKIVSLDIETASLSTNALILELGLISVEVDSYADIDFTQVAKAVAYAQHSFSGSGSCWPAPYAAVIVAFPYAEQISLGRDTDSDTIAWHNATPERSTEFKRMMQASMGTDRTVRSVLAQLYEFCEGADDIWINGLSFDPAILKTLAEQSKFGSALWENFRAESDVRTIYRKFNVDPDMTAWPSHIAINDCVRNLLTVKELGLHAAAGSLRLKTRS